VFFHYRVGIVSPFTFTFLHRLLRFLSVLDVDRLEIYIGVNGLIHVE